MDSGRYQQLSYSPYPGSNQGQSYNAPVYNYPPKSTVTSSTVTDYSNYNNYLYQSSLPAETYNFYNSGQPTEYAGSAGSYYGTPTTVTRASEASKTSNSSLMTGYQGYPINKGQQSEKSNRTWNETLAAFGYDPYQAYNVKDQRDSLYKTDHQDIANRSRTPTKPTDFAPAKSTTPTNVPVTMRHSKAKYSDLKTKHKSYYDTSDNQMSNDSLRPKRYSLIDDFPLTPPTSAYKTNNDLVNEKKSNDNENTAQDFSKGSPLFLKIMSKLAELPDMSRNKNIQGNGTVAPGAPGNSNSSQTNPTTTASSISTDSKFEPKKEFTNDYKYIGDTTLNANTSFSLPAVKMTDKLLGSLGNKTNVVVVRRPNHIAPEPTCSTPIQGDTTFENQLTSESKRLSMFTNGGEGSNKARSTPDPATEWQTANKTQQPSSTQATDNTLSVTSNIKLRPNAGINYSNRFTTLIEPTSKNNNDQTGSKTKSTAISREVETSLINYLAHLNGLNNDQLSETATRGTNDSKTKYSTVNPTNFTRDQKALSTNPAANRQENFEAYVELAEQKSDPKQSKFATVNPSDLKKRINEAFMSLKVSKANEYAASNNDSIKSSMRHKEPQTTATEEIEKAALFSHSSDESITRLAENLSLSRKSKRSEASEAENRSDTAKVTADYEGRLSPVKKIDLRTKQKDENVTSVSENQREKHHHHQSSEIRKPKSEHDTGMIPRKPSRESNTPTLRRSQDDTKKSEFRTTTPHDYTRRGHSKKPLPKPPSDTSETSENKIKLRAKTSESHGNTGNRRTVAYHESTESPTNPYSYRYNRLVNGRPKTELKEAYNLSDRPTRKLSTPPPTPPHILDKDYQMKVTLNSNNGEANLTNGKAKNFKESRPISIASSIRSGKTDKPLRVHHGPPPPPGINSKRQTFTPTVGSHYNNSESHQYTDSSERSRGVNRRNLPYYEVERFIKLSEEANAQNHGFDRYIQRLKEESTDRDTGRDKSKRQSVHVEHKTKPENGYKMNGHKERASTPKRSTNDENYERRNTNLPQLGKIDYIYKTNDDQLMTNFGPLNDTQSPSNNSKDAHKQQSNLKRPITPLQQHINEYNSRTHKNNQRSSESHNLNVNTPNRHNPTNNDISLPWISNKDFKNGKNFYENYSKENDKRKKEGNGFLMLLPGIAIPIDTDADNSDEDPSDSE